MLLAEADARYHWLKRLAEVLDWVERFVSDTPDTRLAWYTKPDAPGLFDHGITAGRVGSAIAYLERVRTATFGGKGKRKTDLPEKAGRLLDKLDAMIGQIRVGRADPGLMRGTTSELRRLFEAAGLA